MKYKKLGKGTAVFGDMRFRFDSVIYTMPRNDIDIGHLPKSEKWKHRRLKKILRQFGRNIGKEIQAEFEIVEEAYKEYDNSEAMKMLGDIL
jgi:hypothetical protein